jgi:hypothetical protein
MAVFGVVDKMAGRKWPLKGSGDMVVGFLPYGLARLRRIETPIYFESP